MSIINLNNNLIVVRGAGDIASGTIFRLWRAGFPVVVLETPNPSAIRRKVSFCEAVFDGTAAVEDVTCTRVHDAATALKLLKLGWLPLLIDENADSIKQLKPAVLVDAILAKQNLGTNRQMAKFVIALGPGFTAGDDCHCVIETMRGHNLGRLIYNGSAQPNTGIPGTIAGVAAERVIHSPADGEIRLIKDIGDIVKKGEPLAMIGDVPVPASIDGVLRGIIRNGYQVHKGLKIADIDPRTEEQKNCFTISDKSRAIGGSVLEAVLAHFSGR